MCFFSESGKLDSTLANSVWLHVFNMATCFQTKHNFVWKNKLLCIIRMKWFTILPIYIYPIYILNSKKTVQNCLTQAIDCRSERTYQFILHLQLPEKERKEAFQLYRFVPNRGQVSFWLSETRQLCSIYTCQYRKSLSWTPLMSMLLDYFKWVEFSFFQFFPGE